MDLATLVKAAMELGVIPALALFLVFAMHLQNRKLTSMLEKHEQDTIEMLRIVVQELVEFRRTQSRRGSTDEAHN